MNARSIGKFFSESRFNPNKPGPMKVVAESYPSYFAQRIQEEAHKLATTKLTASQRHVSYIMIARLAALGDQS